MNLFEWVCVVLLLAIPLTALCSALRNISYRNRKKNCYVDSREEAKIYRSNEYVDDGFTMAQKKRAYLKARKKCVVCRCKTFFGEANTKNEHFLGLIGGAKEGQLHHIVPRKRRGPSIDVNAEWLCAPCNVAISDEFTCESEGLCLAQGWKVYLDPKEKNNQLRSWREIVDNRNEKKRDSF